MMGQTLQQVEHHSYLGVELANDQSWSDHVNNYTEKIHDVFNCLRRNISKCSTVTKEQAYMGIVRPHYEYASSALDWYQNNHIHKVERVQSKANRFVLNQYDPLASMTQTRHQMKCPTLPTCRFTAGMFTFYKVLYHHIAHELPDYETLRGEYEYQYTTIPSRADVFKFSYFHKTFRCWNIYSLSYLSSNHQQKLSRIVHRQN